MKTLLFSLLFSLSITSYSQSIGWKFEEVLAAVKVNDEYVQYTDEHKGNLHFISCIYGKGSDVIAEGFYFNDDNICYKVVLAYNPEKINWIIQTNNEQYVKISELKWKDYKSNFYFEVAKQDGLCYVSMYR